VGSRGITEYPSRYCHHAHRRSVEPGCALRAAPSAGRGPADRGRYGGGGGRNNKIPSFRSTRTCGRAASSFFTAGLAMVLLGVCYWLIDVRGARRWRRPLDLRPQCILVYSLASLLAEAADVWNIRDADGNVVSWHGLRIRTFLRTPGKVPRTHPSSSPWCSLCFGLLCSGRSIAAVSSFGLRTFATRPSARYVPRAFACKIPLARAQSWFCDGRIGVKTRSDHRRRPRHRGTCPLQPRDRGF